MTRTEADLATTIAAVADDLAIDTDAFVDAVKHRARRRRHRQLAVAGVGTAAVALSVAVPVALVAANRAATDPTGTATPDPAIATIPSPRVFTGDCRVQTLSAPLDAEPDLPIWVNGMDSTGRYIVGSYGPPPKDGGVTNVGGDPVRWDNGVGQVLPVTGERLLDAYAIAVNRHGSVVGSLRRLVEGTAATFAWVSLEGRGWSELPMPDGYRGVYAVDINDRNEVVGAAADRNSSDPIVWSLGSEGQWTVRVIDAPDINASSPTAITDDGLVVVNVGRGRPAVLNPDGTSRTLPLPEGTTWGTVEDVSGDWAAGSAGVPDERNVSARITTHVLRWNVRTGEMFIVDEGRASIRATVNARGDVAWVRQRPYPVAALPDAWPVLVTADGQEYELPIPDSESRTIPLLYEPVAMSDDATLIVGSSGFSWLC